MLCIVAKKLLINSTVFIFMFLLGLVIFNLFYFNEVTQMAQVASSFHRGQINNDKMIIADLLADDFIESGVRQFVQTPETTTKKDLLDIDYSKLEIISIEIEYITPLNLLNQSGRKISFIKKITLRNKSNHTPVSTISYVTYMFEKNGDGLRIKKIERGL